MEKGEREEVMICGVRLREVRKVTILGRKGVLGIYGEIQAVLGLIS